MIKCSKGDNIKCVLARCKMGNSLVSCIKAFCIEDNESCYENSQYTEHPKPPLPRRISPQNSSESGYSTRRSVTTFESAVEYQSDLETPFDSPDESPLDSPSILESDVDMLIRNAVNTLFA